MGDVECHGQEEVFALYRCFQIDATDCLKLETVHELLLIKASKKLVSRLKHTRKLGTEYI